MCGDGKCGSCFYYLHDKCHCSLSKNVGCKMERGESCKEWKKLEGKK